MLINMILTIKNPKNIETLSTILLFFRLFDANPPNYPCPDGLRVKLANAVFIW